MIKRIISSLTVLVACAAPLFGDSQAEKLLKKSDSWFSSDAGRTALSNILSWQSDYGDWPKNTDTTKDKYRADRAKLKGSFDNGATLGELRLLARAFHFTGDKSYQKAVLLGFDHILKAQYPNGGWPQYYPLSSSYHRRITFNDNTMVRILEFLRDTTTSEDFDFLGDDRRAAAAKAFEQGVDCILKCQVIVDGQLTVWCAQHDEVTLAPAKARTYELVSLSGAESAGILKFLMSLKSPSPEVIQAVNSGMAWFDSVKIVGFRYTGSSTQPSLVADPSARLLWARFYEIGTNRPMFCDRDGIVKYDIQEIGSERRGGYTWYGNWGESLANTYAKWPHRKP